jgi:hypothetical protein
MAYWFFTPFTIPDKRLLDLLKPERHVVGLHIARNAVKELNALEAKTGCSVKYYTSHGTKNLIAQLLWKRRLGQKEAVVPKDFPLIDFFSEAPSTGLDRRMYESGLDSVKEEAKNGVASGTVISIHPEWLYVRGEKNRRGRFYEALKIILGLT